MFGTVIPRPMQSNVLPMYTTVAPQQAFDITSILSTVLPLMINMLVMFMMINMMSKMMGSMSGAIAPSETKALAS